MEPICTSNLEQLTALSAVINDYVEDNYHRSWRLKYKHHMLWSRNPNSKLMIVQLHPEECEVNHGILNNSNQGFVLNSPVGYDFCHTLKEIGFDLEDFVFVNMIPFFPTGGVKFSDDTIEDLIWIFNGILEIISPRIIITLGYDVLRSIIIENNITRNTYLEYTKNSKIIQLENLHIIPLEDPKVVRSNHAQKNVHFYKTLKRLYLSKNLLL